MWDFEDFAIHFAAGSLVEFCSGAGLPESFENASNANCGEFCGKDGLLPRGWYKGHCSEVVDFIGLNIGQDFSE